MRMRRLKHAAGVFLSSLALVTVFVGAGWAVAAYASGNPHGDKVTICHAAGLAGTTHYVTLTIGHQAVYGPAGHFYENGTPQAGHEQDYLGPCRGDETETTPTETTPTTPTTTTPTTPDPPMCPPPNPDGSYGGQDGKPGNDRCKPDPVTPPATATPPATTPPAVTPPVVTPPPVVTNPPAVTTPKAPKPVAKPKPKTPKTSGKLTGDRVKDRCRQENGLFECTTSTGKKITVVPGLG